MRYLVAIHHPDDYDSSIEQGAISQAIDDLNIEMKSKNIRLFVGGLQLASEAKSIRPQKGGKVLTTDGPYLETKEHIAGFWVLEAADMEEAMEWGSKAALACRVPVEVREFR